MLNSKYKFDLPL